jgi:DNA-binding beta-propeller fold protein YncE
VTLTVFGNNFFPASVARVNGVPQTTVYSNSSELQVTIDPSFLGSMVSLNLTVLNPTPGGGRSAISVLTVYRSVPIEASALVYDSSRNLLYAAVPASASVNPNSVVLISPSTGVLGRSIPVGHDPQRLAISDDNQFLYVGLNGDNTIQRINPQNPAS